MKDGNQTDHTIYKTGLALDINSAKCPSQVEELVPFEEDLINY